MSFPGLGGWVLRFRWCFGSRPLHPKLEVIGSPLHQVLGAYPPSRCWPVNKIEDFYLKKRHKGWDSITKTWGRTWVDRCNGFQQRVPECERTMNNGNSAICKDFASLVLCCFLDWCWWCVDGGNCRNGGMRMRGLYWVRRVDRNGNGEHKRVETNSWDQDICCWICSFCLSLRIQTPPQNRIEGSNFILRKEMN